MTSALDEKWQPFIFFSVQGTGYSATGPHPENGVGDEGTGSPGRLVSSGSLLCKNKTPLVTFPRRFSFRMSLVAPAEMNNTPR